jgi:hypothetical protein
VTFTVIDAIQRSPEWYAARLGRLTASVASDMLATVKSGEAASRRKLRTKLVLERLTGRAQESGYVSPAMQTGIDREAEAFGHYEAVTGRILHRSGFLSCDGLMAGCSLDAHEQGFKRIAEIKNPEDHTHLEYLETGKVPYDYACQVLHSMWVTGADVCDWFSYNPNFPESMQMALVEIKRADLDIDGYDKKARAVLAEVDAKHKALLGWKAVA